MNARRVSMRLATAFAVMLCAGSVHAQFARSLGGGEALGDGKGLARANSNPTASSFGATLRGRNSVIYGTAPGGSSFQGSLGYRDPGEFQGYLGSNNLYNFRRDSAFSGAGGQGIRSNDLLNYKRNVALSDSYALSPAAEYLSSVPRNFQNPSRGFLDSARSVLSNSSAKYTALVSAAYNADQRRTEREIQAQMGRSAVTNSEFNDYQSALRLSGGLGTQSFGRDRSAVKVDYLDTATNFDKYGVRRAVRGARRSIASGYSGYGSFESTRVYDQQTLTTREERFNSQRDLRERLGTPSNSIKAMLQQQQSQQGPSGMGSTTFTPYEQLMQRMEKAAPGESQPGTQPGDDRKPGDFGKPGDLSKPIDLSKPDTNKPGDRAPETPDSTLSKLLGTESKKGDWESRIDQLRSSLRADDHRKQGASLLNSADTDSRLSTSRRSNSKDVLAAKRDKLDEYNATDRPTARQRARDDEAKKDFDTGRDMAGARIDPETLRMIRDAGGKVETLIPSGVAGRDFYTENMKAGELMMLQSRYFDADERFGRALSAKQDDVTALVGRLHAQMGAGLYATAGTGLRRLLASHPETTAQRYVGVVRTSDERAAIVVEHLRATLSPTSPSDDSVKREAALLLAYAGFQLADRKTVEEGISFMRQLASNEKEPQARASADGLIALLSGVWLDDKFYSDAPKPTPSPLDPNVPAGK